MFDPEVLGPDRRRARRARRRRSGARACGRHRPRRTAARGPRRHGRRHRAVAGHGRAAACQARRRHIDVTIGDMATTRVEGQFSLVYLVFNTIGNVITQDAQVPCFANAAGTSTRRPLRDRGRRARPANLPSGRRSSRSPTPTGSRLRRVRPRHPARHLAPLLLADGRVQRLRSPYRYVWPSELDLMARSPGCRWGTGGRAGSARPSRR